MAETRTIKTADICSNTGQIPGVKANPRAIKGDKYDKLKKSLQDNPEMLELRELLVYEHNGKYVCIGGNMRFRACKELGYKEVPCKIIPQTATPDQLNAYIIKDNNSFGEWDWDMLANEWDSDTLDDWGVDVWQEEQPQEEEDDNSTSTKDLTVKFGKYTVILTQKELDDLSERYEQYCKVNASQFGFISSILKGDGIYRT